MVIIRRLHITLIEILIVVMILTLVSGIVGVNIMRALKEQRFRTEVSLMVDTLRLAQDLMLILGTDVHVRVKKLENKEGIEYWLDVEGGVPEKWVPIVKRTRRTLKESHGVSFQELQDFPYVEGQLDIRFLSGGSMMSKGVFRMSTHDDERTPGALTMAICLEGYPHPITSVLEGEEPIECEDTVDQEYNNRLTFYTTQEVVEDNELTKPLVPAQGSEKSEEVKSDEKKDKDKSS